MGSAPVSEALLKKSPPFFKERAASIFFRSPGVSGFIFAATLGYAAEERKEHDPIVSEKWQMRIFWKSLGSTLLAHISDFLEEFVKIGEKRLFYAKNADRTGQNVWLVLILAKGMPDMVSLIPSREASE